MEHGSLFSELSLIIVFGAFVGLIMHILRQPLIIGHILTGVIVGPAVLDLVHGGQGTIDVFAEFGIALLLFIIGLGLNPQVIREVGKAAVLTGGGQVIFTTFFGFVLARALGFESQIALYIAVALTFSSTIIVLKLLNDKREQSRLYGKIAIGFLLVQDIIATLALVVASTAGEHVATPDSLIELLLRGALLASVLYIVSAYILPLFTKLITRSTEFLFLFAIGSGFGVSTLFAESGFSLEIGALAAGVTLAPMVYAQEVASRLRPLRDFFIVLFFISLGAGLSFESLAEVLPQGIIFSLFVLIGNPLIVITIMGLLGYTKKTSFKAGLTVAQISEFSLVFVLLAKENGALSDQVVSLITVVALITIALSTYMIIYDEVLYSAFEKWLKLFERRKIKHAATKSESYPILMIGYRKGGTEFVRIFRQMKKKFAVVDYDPEVIDHLEHTSVPYIYGDATDIELLEEAGVANTQLFVITVADFTASKFLVHTISGINKKSVIICQADVASEAAELYSLGASYVMMPHYVGSERIGTFLKKNGFKKSVFKKYAEKHMQDLQSYLSSDKDDN